jgi:hypothetical protein
MSNKFYIFLSFHPFHSRVRIMGVRHGVSKGVEDGRRLLALWVAIPETAVRLFQGRPLAGLKKIVYGGEP